ncbi:hypothetical protein, partial [Bordetella genomosp. 4]
MARGALAVAMAGAMGAAQAAVTINDSTAPGTWDGNEIVFSDGTGRIEFSGGGTVTGLTDAGLSASSSDAVSGRQLFQTNERVGAAETAITAAQGNIATLQSDVSTAQGNITTLQNDVSTAQGNITTLQSDVSTAQGNITTLQSDVSTAQGNIATLQSQVGDIGTSVTTGSVTTDSLNVANGVIVANSSGVTVGTDVDMGGNKITNLADGTISATSTDAVSGKQIHNLFIEQGATGVRYFHANSAAPDSQAIGQESIAIGPNSQAREDNSFAAGVGAIADGESAIALGDGAQVSKPANNGDPTAAIAIGKNSDSSGVASTAIGLEAAASGSNAVALGTGAVAAGASGLALGNGAVADAENNISIGSGAGQGTGQHLPGDRSHNIAIGTASGQNVAGQFNVAMGEGVGNNVNGDDNVAFGRNSGGLEGDSNVSIGLNANTGGTSNRSVSIGQDTEAQTEGIAIGYAASAGNTGVAIGRQASALGTGTAIGPNAHADSGYVALGLNSYAAQSDVSGNSRFTNRAFSGSAVSVGSSQPGGEFTRRIVNVEDGANDTDAVNVRQLQQAVSGIDLSDIDFANGVITNLQTQIDQNMQHYVSINDGGVDKGNKNNDGAQAAAIDSIAIGPDATTKNQDSIAIGHLAGAEGDSAVVLGHNVKGLGTNSTTIGNSQSEARDESGIAIGTNAVSRDENSIVIGRDSYSNRQANGPSVENSIVIGTESSSTAVEGIVVGKNSVVNAARGIAQGSAATATAQNAMAFGTTASAAGEDSQASGTGASAYALNGIAMGTNARSGQANPDVELADSNHDSIAIGTSSIAERDSSVALGQEALALGSRSTAIGYQAQVDPSVEASGEEGSDGLAIGSFSHSSGPKAGAIGPYANSSGNGSYAIGYMSNATGDSAIALGVSANSISQNGIAIGTVSDASGGSAISIGTESEASGEFSMTVGGRATSSGDYSLAAGYGSNALGYDSLAMGVQSTTNGLRSTAIGRGASTAVGAVDSMAMGTNAAASSTNAVAVGTGSAASAASALALGRGAAASNANAVALGSGAVTAAAVATPSAVIDKNTYNYAGTNPVATVSVGTAGQERTITNVAAGRVDSTSTDAINGSQLYGTNLAVTAVGNDLDTAGQSVATVMGGNATYDPATHQVTTSNIGNTGQDTVHDAIGYAAQGWNVAANGEGTGANVAPGSTVDFSNDDGNVVISRSGTDLAFNLANNIDLGAAGSVTTGNTVMNNDGLAVNDGAGNSTTTTVAGTTVSSSGGASTMVGAGTVAVVDETGNSTAIGGDRISVGGSNPIVISGSSGTIGGLTNTTFDPNNYTSGQAATEDQLKSVSDVANAGWTATDAAGNSANIGPNGVVTFEGDDNLSVAQTGVDQNGVISVSLNENIDLGAAGSVTTGKTIMNDDGVVVNDGGNSTVTSTAGTTVVNAMGEVTTVGAGSITVATPGGGQTTIGSNQINVGGSNPIAINGNTGTIGGLTNTTFDPDNFTSGQAATEDQLKLVSDVANAGWTATDAAGNSANIGPNGVVTFEGDDNLSVAQTGVDQNGVISVSLNENIDLGAAGSVTTGNTVMNNDGLAVNDGAGNTTTVGGNQISVAGSNPIVISGNTGTIGGLTNTTFDPNNYTSGQAATEDQLKQVNDVASAGWNATDAAGNSANIGPNGEVRFEGDSNISVAQTGVDQNGVVAVSLNENIDLGNTGSVTTGNTVMNNDGLAVNDGAGNSTTTTVAGTTVTDAAGATTTVGAGTVSVVDAAGNSTAIGGNQISIGGSNPIVISGNTGTIGGLTNTTFDPNNYTSGQAATEDQLKQVNDVASAGWNATDAAGNTANIGPNGEVRFEGDSNISVAQTGVDQNGVVAVSLNQNIDLGNTGSVTTGNTVMNNDGLAVNDGAGNVTTTTTAGTTVTNAAGDTTTVGAGSMTVADAAGVQTTIGSNQINVGGSNPIAISGDTGTIGGLTNTTFDPNNYTSGQAATEDQLKQVNDVASAGWNVTDAAGNSANIGPNGEVRFEGDSN